MKNYPKTYEECCAVLDTTPEQVEANLALKYKSTMMQDFQKLLVCRNAYLRTDEELELFTLKKRYVISFVKGKLVKLETHDSSYLLWFPTADMRDAFYDNFKEYILKTGAIL